VIKYLQKGGTVAGTIGQALLGAAAGAVLVSGASGADVAFKSPAARGDYHWSGAYFGGTIAYGRGDARSTLLDPGPSPVRNGFGNLFGGAQLGYNHELPSRLVLGVETDIAFPNFLAADDVVSSRTTTETDIAHRLDGIGSVRGRLGYASGHWLIYTTGGFAWSQARFVQTPGLAADEDKVLRLAAGWALGAGAEVAIAPGWSAKFEYLYSDFGNVGATFPSGAHYDSRFDIHMLRVGLNRQLRWPDVPTPRPAKSGSDGSIPAIDWNVHGQFTIIGQGYPAFRSPYEGQNSLSGASQFKNITSGTAYVGIRQWAGTEIYANPEIMQGFGLSDTFGVAGFPNGEAQKAGFPMPRLDMARLFVRQTFGLGGEQETIADGPNQLAGEQDISRITLTVGRFATTDLFDGNTYSHDPRTSFLNWNLMCCGSYDWAMDKISYTWGAVIELNQKLWAFRAGYVLLPSESNGNMFDTHIPQRGQYLAELELRYALFSQPGKLRLFGWMNRGWMGGYADAVALPATSPNYPDIALTRQVRSNYGFVVNLEQAINDDLGIFSRATWSPGLVEVMGWTDCDQSLSLGAVLKGTSWGRPDDKIGLAGVVEGLSSEARAYFAAGGMGILIGDGKLNYRAEKVLEAYYALSLDKWTALTFDYQLIIDPGYNADRGPVSIYAARLHAEF